MLAYTYVKKGTFALLEKPKPALRSPTDAIDEASTLTEVEDLYRPYKQKRGYRHYPQFKNRNLNVSELARVCDLSRTTDYKYLSLLDG